MPQLAGAATASKETDRAPSVEAVPEG